MFKNKSKNEDLNKNEDADHDTSEDISNPEESADSKANSSESKQSEVNYQDKYTRLLAEFANYQRQAKQELESMAKFGNSNLLLKLLDILDDIENGLAQVEISDELKNFLTIIQSKVLHLLSLEGVIEIELERGDDFDSTLAEVLSIEDNFEMENKIIRVLRKGYKIRDRVLRTAKVIVGK